jgi:hypothetical protein
MLKRGTLLVLILAAIITFADWFSSPLQPCNLPLQQHGEAGKTNESAKEYCSAGKVVALWRGVGQTIDSWHDDLTAASTIVIAVFTTILGIFTVSLARSTRIAADSSKESAVALTQSERAHVFITIINQRFMESWTEAELNRVTSNNMVGVPVSVEFAFKNYGKTPAILKEVCRDIILMPTFPDSIEYFPVHFIPSARVVAAGESTDAWKCMQTHISKQDLNAVIRAQTSYWFFGRVLYDDIFGGGHEHRFIYQYNSAHGWSTFHHPEYSKNT